MPYNMFPYTDNDKLNLDWLLRKYKELTDLTSSEDYITVLIDQVHKAIVNGTLPAAAAEEIAQAAADWLDEHVTNPDSPPLDTSLSIAGMAADAGAVGRRAFLYRGVIPAGADLNNYTDNGVWTIGSTNIGNITNVPLGAGAHPVMLECVFSGTVGLQTYRELGSTGRTWQRGVTQQGQAFGAWRLLGDVAGAFMYCGDVAENATLGELTGTGYYTIPEGIAATLTDVPPETGFRGYLLNYTRADGSRYQVYSNLWGKAWYRYLASGATAGAWHEPMRTADTTDMANAFLARMNEKAAQYGMTCTFGNISNPAQPANTGTAQDMFKMLVHAWFDYPELRKFYAVPSATVYALNREVPAISLTNAHVTASGDTIGDGVQQWADIHNPTQDPEQEGAEIGDFLTLLCKSGTRDDIISLLLIGKASSTPGKLFFGAVTGLASYDECCIVMREMLRALRDNDTPDLSSINGTACAALLDEGKEYNSYLISPQYSKTGAATNMGSTNKVLILMTAADTAPSWGDRVQVRSTVAGSGSETIQGDDVMALYDFALCMMMISANRCSQGMGYYIGNLMRDQPFGGR